MGHIPVTSEIQIDHLYAISKCVNENTEWKQALDDIARLVRKIFIFDNLAVYLQDSQRETLEVVYARAAGRGRSAEADMNWGDTIASQLIQTGKTTIQEPTAAPSANRLERPYILGIPLCLGEKTLGAITFIRFGGPVFTPESVHLAEFISQQITLLVERQQIQEAFNALEAEHRQSQLQQDFISTISHELRSPLGFIKGFTTTLLRPDAHWDQKTEHEFLTIIDQETDRLLELIENLLDSSRLQSGQLRFQFQPTRLDVVMSDVVTRARLHHPFLKIMIDFLTPPMPVEADPVRLSQVMENLLSNAKKYAPGSDIHIIIRQDDQFSHIDVQDHGPGIPEAQLPFIFNRFYRSPDCPNIHGSGLGLYICRQIIQVHMGEITASSTLGEGTTIHIKIPNVR